MLREYFSQYYKFNLKTMAKFLVFGDSIAYGAWDKEGGWVQRLRKFLDEKTLSDPKSYFIIYNISIDGDRAEGILARFEFEIKTRTAEELKKENIVVFAIGINDSQFVHSQNNFRTLPKKFRENIQKLINLAGKFASKIVFIGIACVDDSKTTPILWDTDKSYKNEYIKKYNEIIKSVCKENVSLEIHFIDIFEDWLNIDYKKLLEDGLHPNSEGHRKIFESVKDFLTKNKII